MKQTAIQRKDRHQPTEEENDNVKSRGVPTNASKFGEDFLSMFQWNESCIKLIWKQLLVYVLIYALMGVIYNYGLTKEAQESFNDFSTYLSQQVTTLPMMLVMGFFTSTALSRWYGTANMIPGTNRIMKTFIESVKEDVPEGRTTIDHYIRYVLLFWLLNLRLICEPLRKRYPTLRSIQRKTGLIFDNERIRLEEHEKQREGKRTVPLVVFDWLNALLKGALQKKVIDTPEYWRNVEAVQNLKKGGGNLIKFATQNTPNVLIQTVTIAVYCYGLVTMLGHQIGLAGKNSAISVFFSYFPFPYGLSFFFFYIWLKVGRIATDPFGDDEEDIDVIKMFEDHVANAKRLRNTYGSTLNSLMIPTHSSSPTGNNQLIKI